MDPATVRGLTNSQWVIQHLNVLFTANWNRKTWLGQALAQKAVAMLQRAVPVRCQTVRDLAQARATAVWQVAGEHRAHDVLLVDDFAWLR